MKLYTRILLAAALALLASCGTPKNIVYMQDVSNGSTIKTAKEELIRIKPMDKLSIIVSCRDPQVAAMFNLPYYTNRIGQSQQMSVSGGGSSTSQGISGYTVDSQGYIDFPILGKILVIDLTREELVDKIKEELIDSRQIKDPVVTVEFMNLEFAVIGEVSRPGRYKIDRDRFTIFDATSLAGDLTINGLRENVTVVRHDVNKDHVYELNLLDAQQIYASPAFYIQQGDVIYVTPNDKSIRTSTVNGNTAYSTSFWFSVISMITSLVVFAMRFI